MKAALLAIAAWALPALTMAAPPAWLVDKAASKLGFAGTVSGKGFAGVFRRWDAVIHFDPKDLAHSDVTVTVEMASAVTGDGDRDALLPDQDWFWTSHFPHATFVAKNFRSTAPGRYEAAGLLTIRGVAKPLTLPFSLAITGPSAKMNARASLDRLAFGVGQGEWQATDTVAGPVVVTADLTAHLAK
ncbi:MAG: YceI family protein [Caulobacteraceae bacterium]|nr:YceI family protein [Caulobacteraceae bacterium]